MAKKKSSSFFEGAYEILSKTFQSKSPKDFNRLAIVITPSINAYAMWMNRKYPTRSLSPEDYVQVGLQTCWERIFTYEYICPNCQESFREYESYLGHCKSNYNGLVRPSTTIEQYLSFMMKRYMRNLMLHHVRAKVRCDWNTVSIGDVNGFDPPSEEESPEDKSAFQFGLERLKKLVAKEHDQKIRFFVKKCLEGSDPSDIYVCMAENGLYSNSKSARGAIFSFRRRGRFERYKAALS
ncbi:MAG: hypothetical protein KAS32_19830 [Candidatus Peribacteraceae bacterium]|nr:hypothetical protein [Candidatus Peribacteraceae bacterium]